MKKVLFLITVILSASLAGCTAEDGEATVELTDEQVDEIMDEYFQDFVNNTTVTVYEDITNQYYQNGSAVSMTNYYIVDYTFTKSDLFEPEDPTDYMNNTFSATETIYNWTTNQNYTYTYELGCDGYYLVGMQTTPVSYWEDPSNYMTAWTVTYNQTFANLYSQYAYDTAIRFTCDVNYNPNGSATGSMEILTILDITIPAGKGLMCENPTIINMLDSETNTYGYAYGEQYSYYSSGRYASVSGLSYQFDTFTSGISCTSMTLGSGSIDTVFSIQMYDRYIDYEEEYRIYLVYTLVDVEDHLV